MGQHAEHRALVGPGLRSLCRSACSGALLALFAAPAPACDLALALAVDVSGSVDPEEYRLQMDGLAAALRDPTVGDALAEARAALIVVQWSGTSRQAVVVPWTRIAAYEDAVAMAAAVAAAERQWFLFSTGIGEALRFAAAQFPEAADCRRKVIDVSGDGRSNEGELPDTARGALVRMGFTINGLAIEGSEPGITKYYRDHVVGGPGSFVFTAETFEDYPERIRRKLLTEVSTPVTEVPGPRVWRAAAGDWSAIRPE